MLKKNFSVENSKYINLPLCSNEAQRKLEIWRGGVKKLEAHYYTLRNTSHHSIILKRKKFRGQNLRRKFEIL